MPLQRLDTRPVERLRVLVVSTDCSDGCGPPAQQIDERLRTPGAFGPGIVVYGPLVEVPDDAPVADRLLGLLGRDPYWTAD